MYLTKYLVTMRRVYGRPLPKSNDFINLQSRIEVKIKGGNDEMSYRHPILSLKRVDGRLKHQQ